MRTSKILLCIGVLAASLTACQKEESLETANATPGNPNGGNNNPGGNNPGGGNTNGTEVATWNFVSARIIASSTMTGTYIGQAFKGIQSMDLTSINNKGTVAFDGKTMDMKDVEFSVNGNATMDVTIGPINSGPQPLPVQEDFPAFTETAEYKKIGTDSLYFPSGLGAGGLLPGTPVGGKLKWDGTKMTITVPTESTYSDDYNGATMSVKDKTTVVITLQKQ